MDGWTIPHCRGWVDRARRAALVGLAGVIVAATAGVAQGHYVWLERDGARAARAYFGEYGDDLREKTGGLLDRIAAARAFLADPAAPLPIERRGDFLEIAVTAPGDVRLIEAGMAPREDRRAGGKTKTVFDARHGRSEARGALELELVPVAADGSAFTLLFRGAPRAKAEVKVYGPAPGPRSRAPAREASPFAIDRPRGLW